MQPLLQLAAPGARDGAHGVVLVPAWCVALLGAVVTLAGGRWLARRLRAPRRTA